jgi:hypothetical protein
VTFSSFYQRNAIIMDSMTTTGKGDNDAFNTPDAASDMRRELS